MIKRENIQYHTPWVRFVCCLSWAVMIFDASYFNILSLIDRALVYVLTDGAIVGIAPVSRTVEWSMILVACIIPAIPRFERPMAMILCGIMLLFLDILAAAGGYVAFDVLLPMASPMVGIFGSTTILGIMAWNEETVRLLKMERLVMARIQFTDMLVHDLKKRISSVLMLLSVLEKKLPFDQQDKELNIMMHASIERMLLEVNNLLDIRKIEECGMRLSLEAMDLKIVLEGIAGEHKPAAQVAGVNIRLEGESGQEILADRHILSRIMTNLIWNAIQHAPYGTDVVVGFGVSGEVVTISVTNKGESIPVYRQKTIFQPFHSNDLDVTSHRVDGTGLGLAFCKLAVEAHGGTIQVESPWAESLDGVRIVIHIPRNGMLQTRNTV
ncbi:MAG: HAMP domain-containing sensor histidine kinase [Kiritimatiellae bacterium]|nr:HAMP domain-containing sensor histidine kinase [Kiritimatiellia bacterium]MDD5523403.1 HAMP domain-containing sensor histidine kinase [Kiritimatiellia bacterium]